MTQVQTQAPTTHHFGQFGFLGCAILDHHAEESTEVYKQPIEIFSFLSSFCHQDCLTDSMPPHKHVHPDNANSTGSVSSLMPSDRSFLQHVATGEYVPSSPTYPIFSDEDSHSSGIVGKAAQLGFISDGFSRTGCYSFNPDEFEYISRPPYGDPKDWKDGEYIGVQKYLPSFVPITLPDVAIYNSLWPSIPILHLGETVPGLDAPIFDDLYSNDLNDHFHEAELTYPVEFLSHRSLEYYIDLFQSHNNIDEVDDDHSCALKEPEAKCPKVMPGCN
jgi:hypothetical protein